MWCGALLSFQFRRPVYNNTSTLCFLYYVVVILDSNSYIESLKETLFTDKAKRNYVVCDYIQ